MMLRIAAFGSMLLLCAATTSESRTWSLGTQMGGEVVYVTGGIGSASGAGGISVPTSPVTTGILQPGIRVGRWSDNGRTAWLLDTGAVLVSVGGLTDHGVTGMLGYLHTFDGGSSPYFIASAGIMGFGFDDGSYMVAGAGLGYRRLLHHRHGAVRVELRQDFLSDSEGGGNLHGTSLRFGFDLDLD